jgi:hypothetical protein
MRSAFAAFVFICALFLAMRLSSPAADCSVKGVPLHGRVKVVAAFPDLRVKVVNSFPDIRVKLVENFADECGEWRMVDAFPDFTIQYVENFPDVKVQFVRSFPGIP